MIIAQSFRALSASRTHTHTHTHKAEWIARQIYGRQIAHDPPPSRLAHPPTGTMRKSARAPLGNWRQLIQIYAISLRQPSSGDQPPPPSPPPLPPTSPLTCASHSLCANYDYFHTHTKRTASRRPHLSPTAPSSTLAHANARVSIWLARFDCEIHPRFASSPTPVPPENLIYYMNCASATGSPRLVAKIKPPPPHS